MPMNQLREKRGWTQAVLAEKADVSRVHVANIESDDAAPLTGRPHGRCRIG